MMPSAPPTVVGFLRSPALVLWREMEGCVHCRERLDLEVVNEFIDYPLAHLLGVLLSRFINDLPGVTLCLPAVPHRMSTVADCPAYIYARHPLPNLKRREHTESILSRPPQLKEALIFSMYDHPRSGKVYAEREQDDWMVSWPDPAAANFSPVSDHFVRSVDFYDPRTQTNNRFTFKSEPYTEEEMKSGGDPPACHISRHFALGFNCESQPYVSVMVKVTLAKWKDDPLVNAGTFYQAEMSPEALNSMDGDYVNTWAATGDPHLRVEIQRWKLTKGTLPFPKLASTAFKFGSTGFDPKRPKTRKVCFQKWPNVDVSGV